MERHIELAKVTARKERWDFIVIGGGATGIGIALDAAARGYAVCLLEQSDFGKGTSSRSTKLIHGGVRYLQQGNVALVREALRERGLLRQNAPHLVHDLAFIVPNYAWWEAPFYGVGLKVYDMLAGDYGFGKSQWLSTDEVLARIPTLDRAGLRGGVVYFDGQFDDARLLIALARTAVAQGAALVNYAPVTSLLHDAAGRVSGARFRDAETGADHELTARCVINAAGPFCDAVRQMDDAKTPPLIAPSQGAHVVVDKSFLPGDAAIIVPRTRDGRVLFAIPWHGHALLGTTDTPVSAASLEPRALEAEIAFILQTAAQYLARDPTPADVLSVFAGIRPLIRGEAREGTATLSRDHAIVTSPTGLITIAGGKWTTYRKMAEDCITHAAKTAGLEEQPCQTRELRIHGYREQPPPNVDLNTYGTDAEEIEAMTQAEPKLAAQLHPTLPIRAAQIVWAARHEMARTVEDVLARRTRALFLNARAAIGMADDVAALLATELRQNANWEKDQVATFRAVAQGYLVGGA